MIACSCIVVVTIDVVNWGLCWYGVLAVSRSAIVGGLISDGWITTKASRDFRECSGLLGVLSFDQEERRWNHDPFPSLPCESRLDFGLVQPIDNRSSIHWKALTHYSFVDLSCSLWTLDLRGPSILRWYFSNQSCLPSVGWKELSSSFHKGLAMENRPSKGGSWPHRSRWYQVYFVVFFKSFCWWSQLPQSTIP